MKKLNEIINCEYETLIKDIKTDSREIEDGDLFVAIKGYNVDHSLYIKDAINNGAKAVITQKKIIASIPVIVVKDIEKTLIDICKKFYDYNNELNLIGITGTDGKTTSATMIKQILDNFKKTAYIGTNGIELSNEFIKTNNTTPTIENLYKYFNMIKEKNYQNISMEVSSEALLHKRVDSFKFKYIIYTNITEDHLNIHKTIDNYINSKLKLLDLVESDGIVIINNDDPNQKTIKNKTINKIYTYGKDKNSDFQIKNITFINNKTKFELIYNNTCYLIESSFIGEYNVYNLTAAFIVCYLEKMPIDILINSIKNMKNIKGRGEQLDFNQNYKIILDYAHTENGIKNIVNSVKNKFNRIIVVTGSAGGREKEKRKKIGKFLLENTDLTIFTMDDPRYENVNDIIDDMISDTNLENYKRIINRSKAIKYAFDNTLENDCILILGKGRDTYMAIEDRKEYYSDYDEIKNYFKNK